MMMMIYIYLDREKRVNSMVTKFLDYDHQNIYIYIYNYECSNWYIKLEITMKRKSGKHLHVTLNSCFDLSRSHQQCTPWSPPLEIGPTNTVCRSRNSTTGPLAHITYQRCRIDKSWYIARRIDQMCLFFIGTYSLQRTRLPTGLRLPRSELRVLVT